MHNSEKFLEDYIKFHEDPNSKLGDKGNNILYNMCKTYPYHKNTDEIIAKIWLIGRSYAAAIERRRNKKHSNDSFYIWAANEIKRFGFDEKIQRIPINTHKLDIENFKLIYETHSYITQKFYDITKLKKRSLASKYIHFHRPIVPIYDSRAERSIREVFNTYEFLEELPDKMIFGSQEVLNNNREYLKFIKKIFRLQRFLLENNCKYYTARDIDKYLVDLQEKKSRGIFE